MQEQPALDVDPEDGTSRRDSPLPPAPSPRRRAPRLHPARALPATGQAGEGGGHGSSRTASSRRAIHGVGELLLARTRRLLDELERARHELARPAGLSGGALRLGIFKTTGIHLLALTHTYEPAAPVVLPASVSLDPVLVEELVLVTAPGHALADGASRLPLAELTGQPLVSMAPWHRRGRVWAAPAGAGATPSALVTTPGYTLVCALVSVGLGMAVVPEPVARTAVTPVGLRLLEGGRVAPYDLGRAPRRGGLACRGGLPGAAAGGVRPCVADLTSPTAATAPAAPRPSPAPPVRSRAVRWRRSCHPLWWAGLSACRRTLR